MNRTFSPLWPWTFCEFNFVLGVLHVEQIIIFRKTLNVMNFNAAVTFTFCFSQSTTNTTDSLRTPDCVADSTGLFRFPPAASFCFLFFSLQARRRARCGEENYKRTPTPLPLCRYYVNDALAVLYPIALPALFPKFSLRLASLKWNCVAAEVALGAFPARWNICMETALLAGVCTRTQARTIADATW